MSHHARQNEDGTEATRPEPALPAGIASTELYEADDGIVFYDAENPMAWIKADGTVRLEDRL